MADVDTISPTTFDQDELDWGSPEGLPRMPLQSQGSLRLRSQASLKNYEASALLRHTSPKVSLPTASVDAMHTTGLRSSIRSRLQDLDANQDGVIETEELVTFIENVISTEKRLKQLKLVAVLLVVCMGVFMAATFGLTYVVADIHKDTITTAGAMADRHTGDVLRTAQGGYMELNFSSANPAYPHDADQMLDLEDELGKSSGTIAAASRATFRGSGRRLHQSRGPPSGTIARVNAETGCRWLTEGNININIKVLDLFGSKYPAGGATVADAQGCRELAKAPNSKAAISGTIVYHKTTYTIRCLQGASRCSIRYHDSNSHSAHSKAQKSGRRLTAAEDEAAGIKSSCDPVEIGGVWLPVERGTNGECPACFPAAATALRKDGKRVAMSDLAVGDDVQVVQEDGTLGWSTIFMFPHFERQGGNAFVRLTTSSAAVIVMSADHYAYVAPSEHATFAARRAVAARDVALGDLLWVRHAAGGIVVERVVSAEAVVDEGLVNPFTINGNIVVDGVVASVYNDAMGEEARMHSFVSAGRALWRVAPFVLRAAHSARVAQPISLAIGRFFARNLRYVESSQATMTQRLAAVLAMAPNKFPLSILTAVQ